MSETILVLGGYGTTGRTLCELLLEHGDGDVVVAGRSLEKGRRRPPSSPRGSRAGDGASGRRRGRGVAGSRLRRRRPRRRRRQRARARRHGRAGGARRRRGLLRPAAQRRGQVRGARAAAAAARGGRPLLHHRRRHPPGSVGRADPRAGAGLRPAGARRRRRPPQGRLGRLRLPAQHHPRVRERVPRLPRGGLARRCLDRARVARRHALRSTSTRPAAASAAPSCT